jgi:hypothetical protein
VAYSGKSFSVAGQETTAYTIAFSTDGAKFFVTGPIADTVFEYNAAAAFSVSAALDMALETQTFTALASPDSAYVVMHEEDVDAVTLNTDLSTWVSRTPLSVYTVDVGTSTVKLNATAHGFTDGDRVILSTPTGANFATGWDGKIVYYVVNAGTNDFEISLTEGGAAVAASVNPATGIDLPNSTYSSESFSVASQATSPASIAFNTDGTKFFVMGNATDTVYEYTCSVGFDLSSTVAYSGNSFSVTAQEATPYAITFNTDGTKFFTVGNTNDTVYEYTCSVGFDLSSTVAYSGNSFSVTAQDTTPFDVVFNTDGTKFFITGNATDSVFEYTCSVGFDLSSTVAYSGNSFSVASQEAAPYAIEFNTDGTKFFIVGVGSDAVFEYTCSVGFDLSSTVAYSGNSFSVASQDTSPTGLALSADGTKFFMVGQVNDSVYEYNVGQYTQNVTDYGQATLALASDQLVGQLLTGTADLTGQAAGTAMSTVVMTDNAKDLKIHALSTQWK